MIGAIIGDVVGSRFEFDNIKTKQFELVTEASTYTDDTVLTMAVLDWLLHAKDKTSIQEAAAFLQKWAREYPHAGYGGMFRRWMYYDNPRPYYSFGNGSAMRISPLGWFAESEEELKTLNQVITGATHNHPEGLKGAEVTATMILKARKGASKQELRNYALSMYPGIKDLDYEELRRSYAHGQAICQLTVPQAIYCFLISESFEDCLRTTISIGGDCDTTAAISCAIAEAYYKQIPSEILANVTNKLPKAMLDLLAEGESLRKVNR